MKANIEKLTQFAKDGVLGFTDSAPEVLADIADAMAKELAVLQQQSEQIKWHLQHNRPQSAAACC